MSSLFIICDMASLTQDAKGGDQGTEARNDIPYQPNLLRDQ